MQSFDSPTSPGADAPSRGLWMTVSGLFLLSGFCGLVYEIIWLRKAFAAFGVMTPVLSIVVSVFMLGLSLGSWLGGAGVRRWSLRYRVSPIFLYGIAEILIGAGGLLTPVFFSLGEEYLLGAGEMQSARYLLYSGAILSAAILPWCICMGMTYPLMMAFLKSINQGTGTTFSFLYAANVIGATLGAALSAFVLVELFGFTNTTRIAVTLNVLIFCVSMLLGLRYGGIAVPKNYDDSVVDAAGNGVGRSFIFLAFLGVFITGFCSMAVEVVWVRAFTPYLSTSIYAFAAILILYLCATYLGTSYYRSQVKRNRPVSLEFLIALSIPVSILPFLITDPRLGLPLIWLGIAGGIALYCGLLGYLTPLIIDRYSSGSPRRAGGIYAVNIVGCVLGPLFSGYVLLPVLGIKWSYLALAVPFFLLFLVSLRVLRRFGLKEIGISITGIVVIVVSAMVGDTYEGIAEKLNAEVRRDYAATVVSSGKGFEKRLLVNGVGMTILTPITKMMAHLPAGLLERPPENALIICFGMGTTYRSLLSWNIDVTAVELIPSVKDAFPYYFSDAASVLRNPKGEIIVDDGRRYLKRTTKRFDVITIDPPPPPEASTSSLLYSTEFYALIKTRLKEDGILHQWYPGGERKIQEAVTRSLVQSFPYGKVFISMEGWGCHFLASQRPIKVPPVDIFIERMPETAQKDFMEWFPGEGINRIAKTVLAGEYPVENLLGANEGVYISDDKPFNEYFFLRRGFEFLEKGKVKKATFSAGR